MSQAQPDPETLHHRLGCLAYRRRWHILVAALGLYFVAFLAYAVASQRGLVADGAGYFVTLLTQRSIFSPEPSRWASNLLTEWPVLVALALGVTNLPLLSRLHSLGLYYLALAVLPASWLLLPRERKALAALPALTLVLGWMGSCYAAISQSQVMALWFWPAIFALAYADIRSAPRAGILLFLVLPTLLMHEAMCFLGPILAFVAFRRAAGESGRFAPWLWCCVALWLLAGTALAAYFTFVPFNPRDRAGFIHGIVRLHFLFYGPDKANPPVAIALLAGVLMFGCCLWENAFRRWLIFWMAAYAFLLVFAGLAPLLVPRLFAPELQSDARSWAITVPFLLACTYEASRLGLLRIRPSVRPLLMAIGAMAAMAQITWQISATAQWNSFLAQMRHQLAIGRGYIPYEAATGARIVAAPAARDLLATTWTFPQLSIALAPQGRVASIIGNPEPIGWQAFDPRRPASLPRIEGVDYTAYLSALDATAP